MVGGKRPTIAWTNIYDSPVLEVGPRDIVRHMTELEPGTLRERPHRVSEALRSVRVLVENLVYRFLGLIGQGEALLGQQLAPKHW